MDIKTNFRFTIKTNIRCPRCNQIFEKLSCDLSSPRCPHCGAQLNVSSSSLSDAMREADAQVADKLGSLGVPLPEQYADLTQAKKLTRPFNILGVIVLLWTIFFPHPYLIAIGLSALVPIAALLVMASLKGTIAFETKDRKTADPYLTLALAGPPLGLAWRALNDFHIFAFENIWLPAAVISILFSAVIYLYSSDVKQKPAYLLVAVIFGFALGYGMVIEANCLTDRSQPVSFTATVLGKRTDTSGTSTSYYIKLSAWGPRNEDQEISIQGRAYDRIQVNDEVKIKLKEGMLGIPWFFLQLKS